MNDRILQTKLRRIVELDTNPRSFESNLRCITSKRVTSQLTVRIFTDSQYFYKPHPDTVSDETLRTYIMIIKTKPLGRTVLWIMTLFAMHILSYNAVFCVFIFLYLFSSVCDVPI